MSTHAPAAQPVLLSRLDRPARRVAYLALLGLVPLLPHVSSNGFEFPAVSDFWACLPFCALLLLAVLDVQAMRRLVFLDLLVLLSLVLVMGCWRAWRTWPVLLMYPLLFYLAARMVVISRVARREQAARSSPPLRLLLPASWLMVGIAVLLLVHVSWALEGSARLDVASGGVQGALNITHGRALYSVPSARAGIDPHTDTYGPADYEAYVPFASLAPTNTAARLTTLFFDLLTALLLFVLGRQIRGPTMGVLLAYCWLAFPITLYGDALGFNDSLVAASLVATLIVARSPAHRGAMAAAAAWTKFSPLALVPLLAGQRGGDRGAARTILEFTGAFALATVILFVPALAHSSMSMFVSRTFGFQAGRAPSVSIWAVLQGSYAAHSQWIGSAYRVAHGLLAALTGAFAIVLLWAPRRQDVVGLAAASAAVLIALQACLSYYSFSYILWFAPLVLVALMMGFCSVAAPQAPGYDAPG